MKTPRRLTPVTIMQLDKALAGEPAGRESPVDTLYVCELWDEEHTGWAPLTCAATHKRRASEQVMAIMQGHYPDLRMRVATYTRVESHRDAMDLT